MAQDNLSFEKFANDAHKYVKDLATDLGHPEEKNRTYIIWRAVMHTIRDRIHMGESLDLIDPLPMIFKGIYVQNWKFHEKPPLDYETMEEMKNEVKKRQDEYGEQEFSWDKSTEEIIAITISSLRRYLKGNQVEQIIDQMPKEIKEYLPERV